MDESDIPEDVQVLLFQDVHSFEQLEALLLLRGDPTTEWTADDVGGRLNVSHEIALQALQQLGVSGLVAVTGTPPRSTFRYSPANRTLDEITARLANAYQESRFEILRLMSRNAVERLRSSAMRMFADAFILKPPGGKKED